WDAFQVPGGCLVSWHAIILPVGVSVEEKDVDSRGDVWGIWVKVPDYMIAVIDQTICPPGSDDNPPQPPPPPGEPAPPGSAYEPRCTPHSSIPARVSDYNRDCVGDLVAVREDFLHRWYGNGNGGFTYAGTYGDGWTTYADSLTGAGDINRDGSGDLVAV